MASNVQQTIKDLIESSTRSCYSQKEGFLTKKTVSEGDFQDPNIPLIRNSGDFFRQLDPFLDEWLDTRVLIAEFLPLQDLRGQSSAVKSQHKQKQAEFLVLSTAGGRHRQVIDVLEFNKESCLDYMDNRHWSGVHFHLSAMMVPWSIVVTNRRDRFLQYSDQLGLFKHKSSPTILELATGTLTDQVVPEGTESMSLRLPDALEDILPRCKTANGTFSYIIAGGSPPPPLLSEEADRGCVGEWQMKLIHAILGSLTLEFYRWVQIRFKPHELTRPVQDMSDLIEKYVVIENYPDPAKSNEPSREFMSREELQQKEELKKDLERVKFASILRLPYHFQQ